jgi:methylase of polypeptide subunit release factors
MFPGHPSLSNLELRLHRFYSAVARRIRSNRTLHGVLFGYRPEIEYYGGNWDWTTLLLRRALRQRLRPDMRFLDMGTGPAGVLAVYAALRLGCREVWAVDHVPELVASARSCAAFLGLNVHFRAGDLFEGLEGQFDLIAFNAPYIRREWGYRAGLFKDSLDERRWGGGEDGCRTISRFLAQCPGRLKPGGTVLLGANAFHLPATKLEALIPGSGLRKTGKLSHRLTLSYIFQLEASP